MSRAHHTNENVLVVHCTRTVTRLTEKTVEYFNIHLSSAQIQNVFAYNFYQLPFFYLWLYLFLIFFLVCISYNFCIIPDKFPPDICQSATISIVLCAKLIQNVT